jgi:2-C-methyl-D-erythritol 4-phosphate cytidylyltransferase
MSSSVYALVPAAGAGSRVGSAAPKQFASLCGQPVLAHALRALLGETRIVTAFVVLSPDDHLFREHDWKEFGPRLAPLYCGGATRSASVANGLAAIADVVELDDWVLVHDAARPCLQTADVGLLIDKVRDDEIGGLLATPVADTLKLGGEDQRVSRTIERTGLWQALTPQMFRMGILLRALESARAAGVETTDEASAIERLGGRARLVQGSRSNVKITFAEDIELAAKILGKR